MKKLICVLLALTLCLGLGVPALADGGVELPDMVEFLTEWLEDYDVTVRVVQQDKNKAVFGIENVQDMWTVLKTALNGIDLGLQLRGFELISNLDPLRWMWEWDGEYLYAYTGSASVGTLDHSANGENGSLYLTMTDDGEQVDGITVEIEMADGISIESSGADTAPEAAAETASEAGDNIVPDAWAFLRGEITHFDKLRTNGRSVLFGVEREDREALYEYLDLLQSGRFGFTLKETWETIDSSKKVYYVFDYPGTGPDQEVTREYEDRDVSGDLIVKFQDWGYDLWCDLAISFSDALVVADTGDRCTDIELMDFYDGCESHVDGPMGSGVSEPDSPAEKSGSSKSDNSSGSSSSRRDDDDDEGYTPSKPEMKCYKCHGDGDVTCSRCNGDGGKWIYDSVPDYDGDGKTTVKTWESCSKCNGSGEMTCPNCGGSGKT